MHLIIKKKVSQNLFSLSKACFRDLQMYFCLKTNLYILNPLIILVFVQINLISTDNELILCLSCNVKKSRTTVKLSENNWNKSRFNLFQWCPLWSLALILLLFTSLHESGTRKVLLGQWLNNTEVYFIHLLILKITQLQEKKRNILSELFLPSTRKEG
jgi:hypothetical protein